jgi:hypothetical protein
MPNKPEQINVYRDLRNRIHETQRSAAVANLNIRLATMLSDETTKKRFVSHDKLILGDGPEYEAFCLSHWIQYYPDIVEDLIREFLDETSDFDQKKLFTR